MIKRFVYLVLSLAVMAAVAGCSDGKKKALQKAVAEADKGCPVSVGSYGDMTGVKYDEDANMIEFHYLLKDGDLINIGYIEKNKEAMAKSAKLIFSKSGMDKVSGMATDAGAGLRMVYESSSTGKTVEITISSSELKEMKDNPLTDREINEMLYENELDAIQSSLPVDMDEGMSMDKVYDDGSNMVYSYLINESLYDISALRDNSGELKEDIKAGLKTEPSAMQLMKILVALDKGIIYRYKGDTSGNTVDVEMSVSELRAMLAGV